MADIIERAAAVAADQLAATLPRRWGHVRAVAAKAERISHVVSEPDILVAAAWLHDVGYAPGIADIGLHSLDGARWLLRHGWDKRVAGLVAHHSCALFEAVERGFAMTLVEEFPQESSDVADALWFSDMTTGPDGQDFSVRDRMAEIRQRYGPDDIVTRFWRHAEPTLLEAVSRTEARLERQPM
jgi:hypothetical protein